MADWAWSFNFIVFITLAIWARRAPAIPTTIGFLLYACFLGNQAHRSLDLLKTAWILKLPVVFLLTTALVCAYVCRAETKK